MHHPRVSIFDGLAATCKTKGAKSAWCTAGYFLTKIFHPNVSTSGEICVNVLKRDWRPDLGLRHVLTVIRCLLIEPNAESGACICCRVFVHAFWQHGGAVPAQHSTTSQKLVGCVSNTMHGRLTAILFRFTASLAQR